jgi:phage terminase small subunit
MGLTAKQEKFCQGIVAGLSQADAYRQAYDAGGMKPETVQSKASILMADGKVRARVEELRQPVIDAIQYGLREAMEEAEEAFKVAKDKGNGGAMVAAATLRAKLNGLLKDRVDANVTGSVDVNVTFG